MLNKEKFILLAGCPDKWDQEMLNLPDRGQSLIDLQLDQASRGRRSAHMVLSIYGWTVRYASNLQNRNILFGSSSFDPKLALEWGVSWANKDPMNREFYVSRYEVDRCEDKGYDCSLIRVRESVVNFVKG